MSALFRSSSESRLSSSIYGGALGRRRPARIVASLLLIVSLAACSARPNTFSQPRDERLRRYDQERARLRRTTGAVNCTRIQVTISELVISFMGDAIGDGDLERLERRTAEYREVILNARDTMMNSGRDASRRDAGFRDLEIALRQQVSQLDDIGSLLTFEYRQPIEQLAIEVAEMRDELIDAMFPGGRPQ